MALEWCAASATFERSTEPEIVLAVRKDAPARAIIGGALPNAEAITEAMARSVVNACGGPAAFRGARHEPAQPTVRSKEGLWPWNLVAKGFISGDEVTRFLSQQYRVPTVDLDAYEVPADVLELVSAEVCRRHRVLPVSRSGDALIVAVADPSDNDVLAALHTATGYRIEPVIASERAVRAALERYYPAE